MICLYKLEVGKKLKSQNPVLYVHKTYITHICQNQKISILKNSPGKKKTAIGVGH